MLSLLLAGALLAQPAAPPAAPAAMVLEVKGKVELQPAQGKARPLAVANLLYANDRLRAGDGQATLVFFADGHRERLKSNEQATVARSGCTPAAAVEQLAKAGPEKKAVLDGLAQVSNSRGGTTVFRSAHLPNKPAVTPISGSRVLNDRPTFSWPKAAKATSYRIEVYFRGSGRRVWDETTKEPRATVTADKKPLPRGREYRWQVLALNDDDVNAWVSGDFYVASAADAAALQGLQKLAKSSDPADVLLAAVTYEMYDVFDEALLLYERLSRLSPKEGALHAARATLYERAGRPSEAKKAWEQAEKLGFVRPVKEE